MAGALGREREEFHKYLISTLESVLTELAELCLWSWVIVLHGKSELHISKILFPYQDSRRQ